MRLKIKGNLVSVMHQIHFGFCYNATTKNMNQAGTGQKKVVMISSQPENKIVLKTEKLVKKVILSRIQDNEGKNVWKFLSRKLDKRPTKK